ncbi:MAG: hypothetical protein ACK4WM_05710 [Thermoflexales bacterium]
MDEAGHLLGNFFSAHLHPLNQLGVFCELAFAADVGHALGLEELILRFEQFSRFLDLGLLAADRFVQQEQTRRKLFNLLLDIGNFLFEGGQALDILAALFFKEGELCR